MAFNVKSNYALTVCESILSKPPANRHGITGFWIAALRRVQDERLVRLAYMPEHRFVLEADIDAAGTHVMVRSRLDEYIEHELLKRSRESEPQSMDNIRAVLQRCIDQRRLVVAFRNARPLDGDINHAGQNPVWYSAA